MDDPDADPTQATRKSFTLIQKHALIHLASGGRLGLLGLKGVPADRAVQVLAVPALTVRRLTALELIEPAGDGLYRLTELGHRTANRLSSSFAPREGIQPTNRPRPRRWPGRT